ncbi:hypothetical protein [Erwinia rhapontici]|uniref:hypothetical protein n=1 Tax=Erwinia rhapontici TaxID=55212 RepID=UPI003BA3DE09
MKMTVFPGSDVLLSLGLNMLTSTTEVKNGGEIHYLIVSLEPWSLREILNTERIEKHKGGPVIIITDKRMLPLANYFRSLDGHVITVWEKSQSMARMQVLAGQASCHFFAESSLVPKLSPGEFFALRGYFNENPASEQAVLMGNCKKTVYATHLNIMNKFRVRKMSDLTAGHSYRIFNRYRKIF